jgi:amino-acid N-acetyltransferase
LLQIVTTGLVIRAASERDLAEVERLLVASSLPLDGVADALPGFVVAEESGRVVGAVGVERRGEYGLLRSAVVDETARNRGVGRQLVERVIDAARSSRLKTLYLLTTTAEEYFPSFGFEVANREEAPASIRNTTEFTTVCPASATMMKLDL